MQSILAPEMATYIDYITHSDNIASPQHSLMNAQDGQSWVLHMHRKNGPRDTLSMSSMAFKRHLTSHWALSEVRGEVDLAVLCHTSGELM